MVWSAPPDLSPNLVQWSAEIEQLSGGRLILARTYADPRKDAVLVPAGIEGAGVLDRYMRDPRFRQQLGAANALSLNYDGPEGRLHFILLNMSHAGRWAGVEEGLIGHEFGHAWLHARGFHSPGYVSGPRACIASLSGDIVQHVLIRAEMDRRGIPYRDFWIRELEAESPDRAEDPCRRLILLTHLVDALLGLDVAGWSGWDRYQAAIASSNPLVRSCAEAIAAYLKSADLSAPAGFQKAVAEVRGYAELLYENNEAALAPSR